MRFGHNFWLEGPIGLRSMRLNGILQDLLRDTPLDHIWRTQICTFGHICIKPSFAQPNAHAEAWGLNQKKENCISPLFIEEELFFVKKKNIW